MKIQTKLVLIILFSSLLLVSALYFLLQWSVDRGVVNYVNQRQLERYQPVVESLKEHFTEQGNWQEFVDDPRSFNNLVYGLTSSNRANGPSAGRRGRPERSGEPGSRPETHFDKRGHRGRLPPPHRRGPADVGLLDQADKVLVGRSSEGSKMPISIDGELQGWLLLRSSDELVNDYELDFISQLEETILLICLVVFALAMAIGFPLGRHLTKPVALLEQSTARLAAGDFNQRIELQRTDEFGSLQRSFNELASTLQETEESRKRWLADTSHELRTPLSIVRAQIEAMLDDVRPMNKQELGIALTQIAHLQTLMDDLHELSNADIGGLRYSKTLIDLGQVLKRTIESHRGTFCEHNIELQLTGTPAAPCSVHADPNRIQQLLDNVLGNSLKYTSPNGVTQVHCEHIPTDRVVRIIIEDSAPGVPAAEHEQLFEHLYRVENSRNRATGGSGLGLAICKRIVEAHQGSISASDSTLGGLRIEISLPTEVEAK